MTCESVLTPPRSSESDRIALHLERTSRLTAMRPQLSRCLTVGALFATAATAARLELGFDRGLVLSVEGSRLTAGVTDVLPDNGSDQLRRHVLSAPLTLRYDAYESDLIRLTKPIWPLRTTAQSVLAQTLGLANFVVTPVAPEGRTLALLLLDRADQGVSALDAAESATFTSVLAGALAYIVLRAKLKDVADDVRHLMASSQAVLREALETSVNLPTNIGSREAFPLSGVIAGRSEESISEILSEGEMRIARLLVEGRANRAIAERLTLSPETVKVHVAKILRKLGATNRVEAVSIILRMGAPRVQS